MGLSLKRRKELLELLEEEDQAWHEMDLIDQVSYMKGHESDLNRVLLLFPVEARCKVRILWFVL